MLPPSGRHERGFSAIETTIAIVILGIVFLMAIKGTAVVESMRATLSVGQMRGFQTAYRLYIAEHNALPGDDPAAPGHYGRPESAVVTGGIAVNLAGNAKLDGLLTDPLNPNGEPYMAWRDLRYGGYIEGDPSLAGESALPENEFKGVFAFDQGNLGQEKGSLCLTKVPGHAAALIDSQLDDGVINKGKVVATAQFSIDQRNHFLAPDNAGYDDKKTYIICLALEP